MVSQLACAEYVRAGGKKPLPGPPTSMEGQLLWREFWYLIACHTPGHFDSMKANPIWCARHACMDAGMPACGIAVRSSAASGAIRTE